MKIIIFRIFVKLFANFIKVCCYVFHFFFPKKRFRLPSESAPIIVSKRASKIPKVILQTNYTQAVTLPVYINYLWNRILAPTYAYRFSTTEERAKFVEEFCSEKVIAAYKRLQIGASQADLWRILVLLHNGGVYMDIDAHQVWPLGLVIPDEVDQLFLRMKNGHLSNYFIASSPRNNNVKRIADRIIDNIESGLYDNVYDITGPGVFDQVFGINLPPNRDYRITCNQGNFTNAYFQYIDKPTGKWTQEQKERLPIKPL